MAREPHVTAVAVCRYDDMEGVAPESRVSVVRIVLDAASARHEVDRLMGLADRHPRSTYFATPARLTKDVAGALLNAFTAS